MFSSFTHRAAAAIFLLIAPLLLAHTSHAQSSSAMTTEAVDRTAIHDTVVRMLHGIDAQEWEAVRASFADSVTTDYTSLFGGEVQTQASDALVDGWASFLPGFDATQHLLGPLVIEADDDSAQVRCAVTAVHRIGEDVWTVGGHYDVRLKSEAEGWAITHLTLDTAFEQGDRGLTERAGERASR
jgi:hypothetical protein